MDEPPSKDDETSSAPAPLRPDEPIHGDEASATPGEGLSAAEGSASDKEPPKDKKERRSNEFWLAAIGMAGTLLGAIAGGVATYVTGVEHDDHDRANVQTSLTAASQSAQVSFTRAQQLAAYTRFTDSYDDLWAALSAKLDTVLRRYPYDIVLMNAPLAAKTDVETGLINLDHAANLIDLFGDGPTQDAASKIRDVLNQVRLEIDTWESTHTTADPPTCLEVTQFSNHIVVDDLNQLNSDEHRFNDAARATLGITLAPPTSSPPRPFSC